MDLSWWTIGLVLYIIAVLATLTRVIYDTRDPSKTLGYLLLIIAVPFLGMFIYFAFGVNLRKRKLYADKLINDQKVRATIREASRKTTEEILAGSERLRRDEKLIRLMLKENHSPLTLNNEVEVLVNGEEKFPRVLDSLRGARDHIHIEYYRFEDDAVGRELEEVLLERARAGIRVRIIYDDFGSRSIRREMASRLREAGAEVMPFYEITFIAFANRINYRNHRKIIVVDGRHAFVGGINISNDYVNDREYSRDPFWRDTHLYLQGPAVIHLQYIFLNDWNFCCSDEKIDLRAESDRLFPDFPARRSGPNHAVQITASGPDSDTPTILYSILQAIDLARERILITTPYFIPGESLLDNLCIAAGAGIDVQLLVPADGDSKLVDAAAESYYEPLLRAGVRVYQYRKGFVHAKTMVIDDRISIVGTANLDIRSFDLNFEVNAIVYDRDVATQLADIFAADVREARLLELERWQQRSSRKQLAENLARLLSPVL